MEQLTLLSDIAEDTLQGLSVNPKYLLSKYFYDDIGSTIFQNIMKMPEYYLTDSELEIFISQKKKIVDAFKEGVYTFDLIELGSGDGLKTKVLLHFLYETNLRFKYIPIYISKMANYELIYGLKSYIPCLNIEANTGDYFQVMKKLNKSSSIRKVVLFLGSNIGNFSSEETSTFFNQLLDVTHRDDKLLIGFDLKKSPEIIMKAYNDPHGYTRNFNLNHLERLNRELGANFRTDNFKHHTEYNPVNGLVKSFLVSKTEQTVYVEALEKSFRFKQWEPIFMELSRKYDIETIQNLATNFGFIVEQNFTDKRGYFVNSLWKRK